MASSSRIRSLDGIRALSIVLVLVSHLAGTRFFPSTHWKTFDPGVLGVRIFFVISGYLITRLLLDEWSKSNTVSLSKFYFRRTLRIFPAFYAFIAVVALADRAGVLALRPFDVTCALTYTTNYHPNRAWALGHAWSLSVEEQFYLCWPAVVLLLGPRRALTIAAACVLVVPWVRVAIWLFVPGQRAGIGETFPTAVDALATGCVLAGVQRQLWAFDAYRRWMRSRLFFAVPVVLLAAHSTGEHPIVDFVIGSTVVNIAIALLVDKCVSDPWPVVDRFLNSRPVAWVGTLSYSLYLWQQPFLNRHISGLVATFPLNLALAVAVGVGSYYLVERPLLRFRSWLEPRIFVGKRVVIVTEASVKNAPSFGVRPQPQPRGWSTPEVAAMCPRGSSSAISIGSMTSA